MSFNPHAHLRSCSTERGTVLQARRSAKFLRRVQTDEGFQAPGRYDLEKPPSRQLCERVGRPTAPFVSKGPRLSPARRAAQSSCELLKLDFDPDHWCKRSQRRKGGNYMISTVGRRAANRASRAGAPREFMDLEHDTNPKVAAFEARRARLAGGPHTNFLTTPKGCFADGRWHTTDVRGAAARLRELHARPPRFCAALQAGGGVEGVDVAPPEPDDIFEARGEAGAEQQRREARAASLRPGPGGGTPAAGRVRGWHAEQTRLGEPGFPSPDRGEQRWQKSKHALTPELRELMYGYGSSGAGARGRGAAHAAPFEGALEAAIATPAETAPGGDGDGGELDAFFGTAGGPDAEPCGVQGDRGRAPGILSSVG